MYNILFSKITTGFPIIEKELKKIIKSNYKVVIIPWTFAIVPHRTCGVTFPP